MKKNTLKVQPARKIYRPTYPSYADKNPLLYPETRPYPFSQRFIDWAAKGGLAGLILFSGADLTGQAQTDSLYNPFLLENAHLPYAPSMFGTGMPERIAEREASNVIRQAFADEGIQLDYNFPYEKGEVQVILDGYSKEEEIGFVLLGHHNMGRSFRTKDNRSSVPDLYNTDFIYKQQKGYYEERVAAAFQLFLKDKADFIRRETFKKAETYRLRFIEALRGLAAAPQSERTFQKLFIQTTCEELRIKLSTSHELKKEIANHLGERFDNSVEQAVLLQKTYRLNLYDEDSTYSKILLERFKQLRPIKSNREFISLYLQLSSFNNYYSGYQRQAEFSALKIQIMQSHNIREWKDNLQSLEEYIDKRTITLSEVKSIDKKNKKGKQLIAPIFMRDAMMIVDNSYSWSAKYPAEWDAEEEALQTEFNLQNGLTEELLAAKKNELIEVNRIYDWNTIKKLEKPARDSVLYLKKLETQRVNDKYQAMEKLTKEEKEEFKAKLKAFKTRKRSFYEEIGEEAKSKTLRRLEKEVKMYIKWARSQMGG